MPWLEPLPDRRRTIRRTRRSIVGSRESVRLAFVAALQHLSARQRAVLLLRDVLQWKAAEVAEAIGTTTVAVNSLLQRARTQLDAVGPSADDRLAAPDSAEAQDLLARYIAAFETYDIDRLVELFTAEAIWEMPPYTGWYQGARDIITLIHQQCPAESSRRYADDPVGRQRPARPRPCTCARAIVHVPFQLHVLDMRADGLSHVVAFLDDTLFAKFGLPEFAVTDPPDRHTRARQAVTAVGRLRHWQRRLCRARSSSSPGRPRPTLPNRSWVQTANGA